MKTTDDLLSVLIRHVGRDNGITVDYLADELGITGRQVRALVSALRMTGHHICGHPRDGYYIAANADEMRQTIDFMTHRAMHTLTLVSRMTNIAMPDLLGQIHVPT
jgi:biotin operon repressor